MTGLPANFDTTRCYTTRDGRRVVLHDFVLRNSAGQIVTFPVKGVVVESETPLRTRFQIWTVEGRAGVLGDHRDDIVDLPDLAIPQE